MEVNVFNGHFNDEFCPREISFTDTVEVNCCFFTDIGKKAT